MITSIEQEEIHHKEKEARRKIVFRDIILNVVVTLGIISYSFIPTFFFTLIPAHDLIQQPEFWYELIFHIGVIQCNCTLWLSFTAGSFMNTLETQRTRNIMVFGLIGNMVTSFLIVCGYIIWSVLLSYNYPIPWGFFVIVNVKTVAEFTTLWLLFPARWRKHEDFKRRFFFMIMAVATFYGMYFPYIVVTVILNANQNEYQPIIALTLPFIREVVVWIGAKLLMRSAAGDSRGAIIFFNYTVTVQHTVMICYAMGDVLTDTTSWVLMGLDVFTNIYLALRIVWWRKTSEKIDDCVSVLEELVIAELAEFHAPLSFLLIFVVAWFGPNSELFGNIGNSYWQFERVDDIHEAVRNMVIFFAVDFGSAIVSAIILQVTCKINLLAATSSMQKEFGPIFSTALAIVVSTV